MNEAPLLYRLQTLDLDIEEKNLALQNVESQLGESEELIAARAKVSEIGSRLHDHESAVKDTDFEIERLEEKIRPLVEKLYGGTVKNPKELSSLEKDVQMHRNNKGKFEDKALDLMSESEVLHEEARLARVELARVEAAWKEQQDKLLDEKKYLSDLLHRSQQEKESLVRQINPASLKTYESLRRMRRGRAVALVEQNICQGCRVALPIQEVTRARTSPTLSFCSSCGRILLVKR